MVTQTFDDNGTGAIARMAARLWPERLDRALIDGADPAGSRRLAARAAALRSERMRTALADGLERWLGGTHRSTGRWSVLPDREAREVNAVALHELATRLRAHDALDARGVALVRRLVTDGTGAAYFSGPDALAHDLEEARTALDAHPGSGPRPSAWSARAGSSYRTRGGAWVHGRRDGA